MSGRPAAVKPLRPGDPERIGPYRVEGRLGEGGMGEVFLARSQGGRRVAVKRMHRRLLDDDPSFRTRFRQEMLAAQRVGGFYTAAVVGGDADAESPWYASAYIPAPTLKDVLRDEGPLDETAARALCAALAEALDAIHQAGLVHRDLKPANVLMSDDGPRVIDFGIVRAAETVSGTSRLTATGAMVGTPGYLSPEQLDGSEVGRPSDVFALGALLVVATTRHLPFRGATEAQVMVNTLQGDPDLSGVPDGLVPLLRRCLSRSPRRRPTLATVLEETADPGPGAPHPPPDRSATAQRRRPGGAAVAPPVEPPAPRSERPPWSPAVQQPRPAERVPAPGPGGPVAGPGGPVPGAAHRASDEAGPPDPATLVPSPGGVFAAALLFGVLVAAAFVLATRTIPFSAAVGTAVFVLAWAATGPWTRWAARTPQAEADFAAFFVVVVVIVAAAIVAVSQRTQLPWWAEVLIDLGVGVGAFLLLAGITFGALENTPAPARGAGVFLAGAAGVTTSLALLFIGNWELEWAATAGTVLTSVFVPVLAALLRPRPG